MPLDPLRVQAVFKAAIRCDSEEDRAAVLDRECSTDAELRRRIETLLGAHDQADSLLDRPFAGGLLPITEHQTGGRGTAHAVSPFVASDGSDPTLGLHPADISVAVHVRSGSNGFVVPTIEGYEILEELGRGGMGVVFKARQILLNRPCALKMILGGALASPDASARFLAEAQAIARLHHPHIVQIHHIGEAEGLPFFELEHVEGGGLDGTLDGTPWEARRAAKLVESLAGAVAEAHRLGIVHRDLKPGNILLTSDGVPKITDFGLAKSLDDDSGLTATDSIMGSPSYMAPEQAAGMTRQIGPPADIYSLGATLYELLTGRPPFRGTSILETLDQVKNVGPVPPSRLVPGLPRDVETITLRCLQKEPGKRYDSAASLAEDLRRFLSGEPIRARPVPGWERAWRWCRRHPAPAALIAAVVLVSVLGLTGVLWQWDRAVRARDLEVKARRETETTLVDMYTTSGIAEGEQGEHARAALWFANAARRAEADPDRRLANSVRARTWGRRAFTPLRAVLADGAWQGGLVIHPGGRHLITKTVIDGAYRDVRASLRDLDAEQSLPFSDGSTSAAAAWSPDGKTLALGGAKGDVIVSPFPGSKEGDRIQFSGRIRSLIYSADGRYLAIAGGNLARVWDVRSRTFATADLAHPAAVMTLAFHPEGRYLATGCQDHQARLFAVPGDAGRPLWPPVPHRQEGGIRWYPTFGSPPLFVDGGRGLISYGGQGGLEWHSVETGTLVRTLKSPDLSGKIAAVDLSPDGRHLAVSGFQTTRIVRLFEIATGRPVGPALDHQNTVFRTAFSPDGRMLATSSTDNTVRLWAVPGGEALARPLELHRPVSFVAFTPDGRSLATQDGDLIRLWSLPREGLPTARLPLDGKSSFASLSPDGSLTIPTGMSFQPESVLWSTRAAFVATGQPAGPALYPGGTIVDAAFSPDGRWVAMAASFDSPSAEGREIQVWDWASGLRRWRMALPSNPRSLAYRPDGHHIAVLCGGGELLAFDTADGRESVRWQAHDAEPAHHWVNNGEVGFSPDGRSVLTWGMGNDLRVWETDTGRLRYPPIRHRDKCHDVQFSPDGQLMVLASYDGSVRVRDFATGAISFELPTHPDLVYSASFSPDGRLLVTACRDRTIRVWDWRGGKLACAPFEHAKDVTTAIFTPDGRWVLSASVDGTARVWDWRTGKPITPPVAIEGEPLSLAVTPDGRHAVVGGGLPALAVLDLGDLATSGEVIDAEALCLRAELAAGQRLHGGGGMVNLSADEWLQRWREFRQQSPVGIPEHHASPGTIESARSGGPITRVQAR